MPAAAWPVSPVKSEAAGGALGAPAGADSVRRTRSRVYFGQRAIPIFSVPAAESGASVPLIEKRSVPRPGSRCLPAAVKFTPSGVDPFSLTT